MKSDQIEYVKRKQRFQSLSKIRVIISTDKGKQIRGHLIDISSSGILVNAEQAVSIGQSCSAKIFSKLDNSRPTLSANGTIVRHESSSMGIKFNNDLAWWFLFCILASFKKPEDYLGETVCSAV